MTHWLDRIEHWALRILCAVAIIFVGFAHQPPAKAEINETAATYADYRLPDGSLASLCLTAASVDNVSKGERNDHHKAPDPKCEACRISATSLLPAPFAMADTLFRTYVPVGLPLHAQTDPRRSLPPNTGPRAPPVLPKIA